MRSLVDGIMERWLETVQRNARWFLAVLVFGIAGSAGFAQENMGPVPAGEERSNEYAVQVEGRDVPVYVVKVAPADPARRWQAMDDKVRSAEYFDKAAFAYFDMGRPAMVTVACVEPITSAKILPSSLRIVPAVEGKRLTFSLTEPKPVTVEVNGRPLAPADVRANAFVRNVSIRP
jgi:hypothetical protein